MRRYLSPAAICLALGFVSFWLIGCGSAFLPPPGAVHPPGSGKLSDWTAPQSKYLHIYVWAEESDNCPTAIKVIPNDAGAEVWKKLGKQPKRVVWVVRDKGASDVWTIQTKPATEDHFDDQFKTAQTIPARVADAFWSVKAKPKGNPKKVGEKEYWEWKYNLTVKRPACAEIPLDPPVYIRKK